MTKQRDVAWGFFTEYGGGKYLLVRLSRADAVSARAEDLRFGYEAGPIFKITGPRTPPRTKPRKGRSK